MPPMTSPRLHTDEFATKHEAPPMSTIDRGYGIIVRYSPRSSPTDYRKTVRGTIRYASYGEFSDKIEFEPHHTDNLWRVVLDENAIAVCYKHGTGSSSNWRQIDEPRLETTAQITEVPR